MKEKKSDRKRKQSGKKERRKEKVKKIELANERKRK